MRPREQFCCTNRSNNQPEAGALQGPPVAGSRRGLAARAETAIERDPHECRSNNLPGAEAAIEQRAPHDYFLIQGTPHGTERTNVMAHQQPRWTGRK
eukprot:scaffold3303_cov37-Cyclotella_meneghiniana.AAC.2